MEVEHTWRVAAPTRIAVPGRSAGLRRSDRFLIGLHEAERVVFVSHINPDPDSLGSMFGLAHLVETRLGKSTLMTRDGLVTRAENRAMVDVLNLDLVPIDEVDWRRGDAVVMVDSQPNTGRHSISEATDSTRSSTTTTRRATSTASRSSIFARRSARPARW